MCLYFSALTEAYGTLISHEAYHTRGLMDETQRRGDKDG
jgi:hypothetical protein